jgi:pentatricopeptide repeat protein
MHGCGEEAITVFHRMIKQGIQPDAVTFGN